MRFLVTGGCGFIGSHLCHALHHAGHDVRVLDNLTTGKRERLIPEAELIVGDVADRAAVAKAAQAVDGIFHLAAIASVQKCNESWLDSHKTNLTGTITVLDTAAQAATPIPVVYASSAAVYGDNDALPLGEDALVVPVSFYGQDKLAGEHYARLAFSTYGVPSSGIRIFNAYGPGQDPGSPYSGVISRFGDAAQTGAEVTIYGDGEQSRDFIYVGDVVRIFIAAMAETRDRADVYNAATGKRTSLLNLLSTLEQLIGRAMPRRFAPARLGDIRHSLGNGERAKMQLGFAPITSLKDGLAHTLAFTGAAHA